MRNCDISDCFGYLFVMAVNDLINLAALEALEQAEILANRPVRHRLMWTDPFEELSNNNFRKLYRLDKQTTEELIDLLQPHVPSPTRISGLRVTRKVLTALRFLASGSYQNDIGRNVNHAISQYAVSRAISEVTDALNIPNILNQYIYLPRNIEECRSTRNKFFEKHNFPGVLGCLDCTHVAIYPPLRNHPIYPEAVYINRKRYHSINVQLICDSDMKITNICARYPGSTHDSYIWSNSQAYPYIRNLFNNEQTYYFLGDSGYPLRPWIQTPFPNAVPETAEDRFNIAHRSTRSLIERTNGILKLRFRCLLKHRVLHYSPHRCSKIINSCAVLHNICINNNLPPIEFGEDEEDQNIDIDYGMYAVEVPNEAHIGNRVNPELIAGRRLQQQIIQNHFG